MTDAVVQSVSPITSTLKLSPKETDLHEIALIALFGDGVLNVDPGGRDSMVLKEADHSAFLSLGPTEMVHCAEGKGLLLTALQPCSKAITQAVLDYSKSVRAYDDDHPSTTGPFELEDTTQNVIVEQSTPAVLQSAPDISLLITIGSDFDKLEDNRTYPFFTGNSRSAVAIQDCFNHFALWEQPLGANYDINTVRQLVHARALPFVDLFAWFKRESEDYLGARQLLNQYLTAVKPLVILRLGERVCMACVVLFYKLTSHSNFCNDITYQLL